MDSHKCRAQLRLSCGPLGAVTRQRLWNILLHPPRTRRISAITSNVTIPSSRILQITTAVPNDYSQSSPTPVALALFGIQNNALSELVGYLLIVGLKGRGEILVLARTNCGQERAHITRATTCDARSAIVAVVTDVQRIDEGVWCTTGAERQSFICVSNKKSWAYRGDPILSVLHTQAASHFCGVQPPSVGSWASIPDWILSALYLKVSRPKEPAYWEYQGYKRC